MFIVGFILNSERTEILLKVALEGSDLRFIRFVNALAGTYAPCVAFIYWNERSLDGADPRFAKLIMAEVAHYERLFGRHVMDDGFPP